MLKWLQITFLTVLAVAIAFFSAWRYFHGGAWWLFVLGALFAYVALLSSFFWGSQDAWHKKVIQFLFEFMLSTELRTAFSLVALLGITSYLGFLTYKALPPDTAYYEIRVYENVDLPTNYLIGAKVTIHSRTDGITYTEIVSNDGSAIFRSLIVPTTLTYQIEVISADPPFVTGDNYKIDNLPDLLAVDIAAIPDSKRLPLNEKFIDPAIELAPRPENYLLNVDERGDEILQTENAPWGVPEADLVLNRLGYVLGYDLERKLPRWVAYSVGPTEITVPQTQDFLADPAIALDKQANRLDYSRSGYDRGHLISPTDLNFKGPVTVQEAFYYSTMAPQTRWANRGLWKEVEVIVRDAVELRQQPAFIIAGPLFIKPDNDPDFEFETIGDGQIPVPTHFFRIMTMVNEDQVIEAFGLIVPNAEDGKIEISNYIVSIDEIEKKSGLIFFPLLDSQVAEKIKMNLGIPW